MIFPRYHQLDAVRSWRRRPAARAPATTTWCSIRRAVERATRIAWLAHRLASLHDAKDQKVFDSVVVVTDRRVLDQQLQDTIYQFEHKSGVVQKIDEDSTQLADALKTRRTDHHHDPAEVPVRDREDRRVAQTASTR